MTGDVEALRRMLLALTVQPCLPPGWRLASVEWDEVGCPVLMLEGPGGGAVIRFPPQTIPTHIACGCVLYALECGIGATS